MDAFAILFQANASLNHAYPHAVNLWSACTCLFCIGNLDPTDAQQTFQQSEAKHADLLSQLKTAQLATQQAHDAQVEAEQQLQITQQASAQKLNQVTADFDQ